MPGSAGVFRVLARVSGMFSSRGYNIESLAVGTTHDPSISRLTMAKSILKNQRAAMHSWIK